MFYLNLLISLNPVTTKDNACRVVKYKPRLFVLPDEQDELKEILQNYNYTGNIFEKGLRRSPVNNLGVTALCLDYDNIRPDEIQKSFQIIRCNYIFHTTTSHTDKNPHFRIILPFNGVAKNAHQLYTDFKIRFFDSDTRVLEPARHFYPYLGNGNFYFKINEGCYIKELL